MKFHPSLYVQKASRYENLDMIIIILYGYGCFTVRKLKTSYFPYFHQKDTRMQKYVTREKRVCFPAVSPRLFSFCWLVPISDDKKNITHFLVLKTIFYSLAGAGLVRKHCFHHSKIIFISSRHRVIYPLYIITYT